MKRMTAHFLGLYLALSVAAALTANLAAEQDYGEVFKEIVEKMKEKHYSCNHYDDEMSSWTLNRYLDLLDYNRLYFLSDDIETFRSKYKTSLDDMIEAGDGSAPFEIYGVFQERVRARFESVETLLRSRLFPFSSGSVKMNREEESWPSSEQEADEVWSDLLESEILEILLEREKGNSEEETLPREKVLNRYRKNLASIEEMTDSDIVSSFGKSIVESFDSHSTYYTPTRIQNFEISRNKSLVGIGALLSRIPSKGVEVQGIVVGGPAQQEGSLKIGDLIVSVGQGTEALEDIQHLKLSQVVDLIRGEEGTVVRLKVIPAGAVDASEAKTISITRNTVELSDSRTTSRLIVTKYASGETIRLGWIDLPSFYGAEDGSISVATDVKLQLARLILEGIDGLVLDLSDNGGGRSSETTKVADLFLPKGPLFQTRLQNGNVTLTTLKSGPYYEGPMVVRTARTTAGTAETFTAGLQDYKRAVIVGERNTYGMGSLQSIYTISHGAMNVTTKMIFRPSGNSFQKRGVIPDIVLPSSLDALEFGENGLENPLPYEEIAPTPFDTFTGHSFSIRELRAKSQSRVATNPDFQWIQEENRRFMEQRNRNSVSLDQKQRRENIRIAAERKAARQDDLKKRYAAAKENEKDQFTIYGITINNVADSKLRLLSELTEQDLTGMQTISGDEGSEQIEPPHGLSASEREVMSVLIDLIESVQ